MVNLSSLTIQQAATLLQDGQVSCVQMVQELLQRIDDLDPTFRAWVTVDHQGALAQAQQLDEEFATAGPRGALHGIPIGCSMSRQIQRSVRTPIRW